MTPKPSPHSELIEPLQSFLDNLTQELTEQKFIPAFREELSRLIGAIDNLQRSEDTLQQIARGVDRLRDVFGPAGTRLLEGVKDLEVAMKSNAASLKDRAGDVVTDLLNTHDQLEQALRGEHELMQGQSAASREAIVRITAETESRLQALTGQMDALFRKLENETSQITAAVARIPEATQSVGASQATASHSSSAGAVEMSGEVRDALSRTESVVLEELRRYRKEVGEKLSRVTDDRKDQLEKIDRAIGSALSEVSSRVRGDLDQAVARLRDQMQLMVAAHVETRVTSSAIPSESNGSAAGLPPELITASLSASESRVLSALDSIRSNGSTELSGVQRAVTALESNLSDLVRKQSERMTDDATQVFESVAALDSIVREIRESDRQNRERLGATQSAIENLTSKTQVLNETQQQSLRTLEADSKAQSGKLEEVSQHFSALIAGMARAEQAATTATELTLSDSRAQRERIESGLREVRERIEKSLQADSDKLNGTLQNISSVWNESLDSLREFIHREMNDRVESLLARVNTMDARGAEADKDRGSFQREIQSLLGHSSKRFDEQLEALKHSSESFTTAMEQHVKAVSADVTALRAKQDQSLAVLREAIRSNYDDNAQRLKEVIDRGTDAFVKQIAVVPQALERYAHLHQSLHQGDQIALQAITSDTQNILALSTEKFETLISEHNAMKKYFPVLDKRLEKYAAEVDGVRSGQKRLERGIEDAQKSLSQIRDENETRIGELRGGISSFESTTYSNFQAAREAAARVSSELLAIQETDLPAFRRELSNLLTSKFEFMETTLNDRGTTLRNEFAQQMAAQKKENTKIYTLLGLLTVLAIAVQMMLYWLPSGGVGK